MGETLKKWLKSNREMLPREELMLNLRVASALMGYRMEHMFENFGITSAQYNVLRILKGVYPGGHPRCEIITRMVERSPDTTRLIDRLEKQKLVERVRTDEDRRMSITKITAKGLNLVAEVQPLLENEIRQVTKKLSNDECKVISRLIEKLYDEMT